MLFDPEREARQLFELGKPNLKALSYALRHRELWPECFNWDFCDCKTCAMGLAYCLWVEIDAPIMFFVCKHLGLAPLMASKLFLGHNYFYGRQIPYDNITPEMVADAIDAYLGGLI